MKNMLYKYKSDVYKVLNECEIKMSGGWEEAVSYTAVDKFRDVYGKVFVRVKEDFLNKFEKVGKNENI